MGTVIPPTERQCERCGRVDIWDDESGTWVAAEADGTVRRGDPHCVHEWDIDGTYNPIEDK